MRKKFANRLIVIMSLFLIFTGCQTAGELIREVVQTPKVSLEDIAITGISSQKLDLDIRLAIDNPNPISLDLAGIDYELELSDKPFFSGKSDKAMNITASGRSSVKIPISLEYENLRSVYDSIQKDEFPYRLSGKVQLNTPVGQLPVPYDIKGKLPVVRPPKLNDVNLRVTSLSLSSAKFDVNIKLLNPNSFPLDITKLSYQLIMDGKEFSEGEIESAMVSAKSEGYISIPVSLDLIGIGNWAYNLLKGGSSKYQLNYDAEYRVKNWPVKQMETKSGTLKIKK